MTVSRDGEVALCSGGSLKIGETSLNENELKAMKSGNSGGRTYSLFTTSM
jgi:hypothetical protein